MNSWIDLLACPFCKLGMDELQARAMEYSIYFLLALIYSLIGVIGFNVWRMMAREERALVPPSNAQTPRDPGTDPATSGGGEGKHGSTVRQHRSASLNQLNR